MNVIDAKRLAPWEEGALRISDLIEDDGYLIAIGGNVRLRFPMEMKVKLVKCLGFKIAVLRTDFDYRLRILDEKSQG